MRIELDTSDLIANNKLDSSCYGIRVLSNEEKINHWIADNSCNSESTHIWVKVPSVSDGINDLTICYGDETLDNESNSSDVFPVFFDDFNLSSISSDYLKTGSVSEWGQLPITGSSSYSRVSKHSDS